MYFSPACWKTSAAVDRELNKLSGKTAKLQGLKENIRMRVLGLGWSDLATPWSKNGKAFSTAQLATHLKLIISKQRTRHIPEKPPANLPTRKVLPNLGTVTADVIDIDMANLECSDEFENKARTTKQEREAAGVGDRFALMQPHSQPVVDCSLIGTRLDVCHKYDLNDGSNGSQLHWSQGVVILVSDGTNIVKIGSRTACYNAGEAVIIRWDANPVANEESTESIQCLKPRQFNPVTHSDGSWRLDLDVAP
jgi:hypothetical protein